MNKRSMLAMSIALAAIGTVIAVSGGISTREVAMGKAVLGVIIAACGFGGAMGTSVMAAGVCLAIALGILAMVGISVGSVLLCCIPAIILVLHLVKETGNC